MRAVRVSRERHDFLKHTFSFQKLQMSVYDEDGMEIAYSERPPLILSNQMARSENMIPLETTGNESKSESQALDDEAEENRLFMKSHCQLSVTKLNK